jgi:DNA-binding IscR family transcriptional regulator
MAAAVVTPKGVVVGAGAAVASCHRNAKRLTLMDIIQMFEDLGDTDAQRMARASRTPVELGLSAVMSEIDENAKATFKSITLATMMRLIDRQQAAAAAATAGTPPLPAGSGS